LECGDLSPLSSTPTRLGVLGRIAAVAAEESGDISPHSKNFARFPDAVVT
jgi:hypothetical protein